MTLHDNMKDQSICIIMLLVISRLLPDLRITNYLSLTSCFDSGNKGFSVFLGKVNLREELMSIQPWQSMQLTPVVMYNEVVEIFDDKHSSSHKLLYWCIKALSHILFLSLKYPSHKVNLSDSDQLQLQLIFFCFINKNYHSTYNALNTCKLL